MTCSRDLNGVEFRKQRKLMHEGSGEDIAGCLSDSIEPFIGTGKKTKQDGKWTSGSWKVRYAKRIDESHSGFGVEKSRVGL